MPRPKENIKEPEFVYRRVLGSYRHEKTGKVKPTAFKAKQGEMLSVFDPARCLPRDVLQNGLDVAKELAALDDPEKKAQGERQLQKYGDTVEDWVANACTVVAIRVAQFSKRGFMLEEPDPNGHRNVSGEDFELYMEDLRDAAAILSDETCLTTDRSVVKIPSLPYPSL